nr:hypothetical protein [Tanacetum cinerariifolium]
MTTLADKAILSGADNRPPMLEKDMYDSWKSRMELYMMNRQHERMILESLENGPLIWLSIEENGVTRPHKYSELSSTKAIPDCDVKATNIILQGLPPEGEFYLRFSLLLNDIKIYNKKLEQFQVNTKFLNTLPPEWSKFVTDIKLVRDLYTTNVDQLHAYLGQHEFHANEVRLMHEHNSDSLALVETLQMTQSPYQIHQHSYQHTQFLPQVSPYQSSQYGSHTQSSTPLSITYPPNDFQLSVHHNLRNSSNPRQQTTINNGRVTVQPIQGRHTSLATGTSRTYTSRASGNNFEKQTTVICFNYKREGVRILVDPGIAKAQTTHNVITHNAAYQADDIDAYDSNCDEINTANVALLVNLSHYGFDDLAEVHNQDNVTHNLNHQVVQAMPLSEQSNIMHQSDTEITNNNNIFPYSQYSSE